MGMSACMRVRVCVNVCACVCERACACMCTRVHTRLWYTAKNINQQHILALSVVDCLGSPFVRWWKVWWRIGRWRTSVVVNCLVVICPTPKANQLSWPRERVLVECVTDSPSSVWNDVSISTAVGGSQIGGSGNNLFFFSLHIWTPWQLWSALLSVKAVTAQVDGDAVPSLSSVSRWVIISAWTSWTAGVGLSSGTPCR